MAQSELKEDLLKGAPSIAAFLGWKVRDVYYGLERGHLPATKLGSVWIASKQKLRERLTGAGDAR